MPTTERSFASTTVSQPAARMRSPPTPKNSSRLFESAGQPGAAVPTQISGSVDVGTAAPGWPAERSSAAFRSATRGRASMSCAPYSSPEASPADIRIRKSALKGSSRCVEYVNLSGWCYFHLCSDRASLVIRAGGDLRLLEAVRIRGRGRPRYIDLLILVLQLIQLEVNPALGQELLVRSHFADLAFVHDDDFVGALHRRKPVRDDQRRAPFDHTAQRVAYAEFGFGIYARCGFVQNQNLRIVRQGAGEGDELLLAGGERRSALADLLVEPAGQCTDEVGEVHIFGGLLNVVVSNSLRPQANIPRDGTAE